MQAAIRERYGPPEIVTVQEIDRPVPTGDQVLVRIRAASINRADLDALYPKPGFTRLFLGLRTPKQRRVGYDVAGVVEAVGEDVTGFAVGNRVFADLYPFGAGSLAEFVSVPERAFVAIPDAMTDEVAATLPHAAILALQGLRLPDGRRPGPGDRVLVVGASGSVGPFAVQIAKSLGAHVTGVCSAAKVEFVRSLGADHVIDYSAPPPSTRPERYDWILDTDSHQSILASRRALRPKGIYVTLGGTGWKILKAVVLGRVIQAVDGKRMGLMLWWKPFLADDVATLGSMIAAGTLAPSIDRRYPLSEAVDALRYVDEGHARGKVIVTP